MKRYKLGAVNSYYQYQMSKIKRKQYLVLVLIGLILASAFVMTGQFDEDINALLSIGKMRVMPITEGVYLVQPSIDYSVYVAPQTAKGIYIPVRKLDKYKDYIKLAKKTGINSFVIDVKDDEGYLTFKSDNELLINKGMVLASPPIKDIKEVMDRLCEANIYPIARVVAFKDDVAAVHDPSLSVKSLDGSTYVTASNDTWLDPYKKENWEYLLEVSKEAAKMGFKEIQFDYVRFHESMNENKVVLDDSCSKTEIITEFIKYICENLHDEGIKVSADVFGAVVLSDVDAQIVGQDFRKMSKYLDYICPMIYPSHYAQGTFGIEYPYLKPYQIINKTMKLGMSKLSEEDGEKKAVIRPWLQDFTLKSVKPYIEYGPAEIEAQIKGAKDAGVEEWLFWNAAGNYTEEGLRTQIKDVR